MPYDPARHGPRRIVGPGFYEQVYEVVRQVPEGFVTTYGDVGAELGSSRVARQVGYALAGLSDEKLEPAVPWYRVVNGRGRLSFPAGDRREKEQRRALHREGVRVDESGRVHDFSNLRYDFDAE